MAVVRLRGGEQEAALRVFSECRGGVAFVFSGMGVFSRAGPRWFLARAAVGLPLFLLLASISLAASGQYERFRWALLCGRGPTVGGETLIERAAAAGGGGGVKQRPKAGRGKRGDQSRTGSSALE